MHPLYSRIHTQEEADLIRQNWLKSFKVFLVLYSTSCFYTFLCDSQSFAWALGATTTALTFLFLEYYFGYIKNGFYFLTFMIYGNLSKFSKSHYLKFSDIKTLFNVYDFSNIGFNILIIAYICSMCITIYYIKNCFHLAYLNFSNKRNQKQVGF